MSNFNIDIEKQLSKLGRDIQQFVEKVSTIDKNESNFQPDCDVVESSNIFSVFMDLPGMNKKQINITLKNNVLSISGERELFLDDDEVLKRSERKQGSFSRSFALPETADKSSISATFKDGVLQVKVLKAGVDDTDDPQSIPIK